MIFETNHIAIHTRFGDFIASMYHTEFIQVLGRILHCKVFVGYNPTALRINTDY